MNQTILFRPRRVRRLGPLQARHRMNEEEQLKEELADVEAENARLKYELAMLTTRIAGALWMLTTSQPGTIREIPYRTIPKP